MPRLSGLRRARCYHDHATIARVPFLSFLLPALETSTLQGRQKGPNRQAYHTHTQEKTYLEVERVFLSALNRAGSCCSPKFQSEFVPTASSARRLNIRRQQTAGFRSCANARSKTGHGRGSSTRIPPWAQETKSGDHPSPHHHAPTRELPHVAEQESSSLRLSALRNEGGTERLSDQQLNTERGSCDRCGATFESSEALAAHLEICIPHSRNSSAKEPGTADQQSQWDSSRDNKSHIAHDVPEVSLTDQLRLLKAVRELEKKLQKARHDLHKAMEKNPRAVSREIAKGNGKGLLARPSFLTADGMKENAQSESPPIELTKDDYLNLVDLYFYSHQSRFAPDSPDMSPNPLFLESYSFKLSEDFSKPEEDNPLAPADDHKEPEISPLRHVEAMLKSRQLHEISTMQVFVDLLLDDYSSDSALFQAYKSLPKPGVAYLPAGVIRLFLQRMSTPWTKSENTMLRYLSLIDDMQEAGLPITVAEWSSAIYLAGRSFSKVTESEVTTSFAIWRQMENEAGVKATHVTFNILFDIAVRAGKFVLAEAILQEMHERGLRLNRLGRVSLIYFHGCRGDGDGVRKTYRDFVEAGEIVDTLVLNCVMVSLIHAQEPAAAEQVYERMKALQDRLRKGRTEDGEEALFSKYPPPGPTQLERQMASNSLGRVLLNSARLREVLPDHHMELQAMMPLTPNYITFRNLICHHATTSGNLDRLTVLMNDMIQQFNLPINTTNFRHILKGFAIHGGSRRLEATWTVRRLELAWQACLAAIRATNSRMPSKIQEDNFVNVPSVQEAETMAEALAAKEKKRAQASAARNTKRSQTPWGAFLADFTTPPGKQSGILGPRSTETYSSPLFSGVSAEEAELETEADSETDYISAEPDSKSVEPRTNPEETSDVRATKGLVLWVIRAFARCTRSRRKLEEVWVEIQKVWRPIDSKDRDAAVRVLRFALKQCDQAGP